MNMTEQIKDIGNFSDEMRHLVGGLTIHHITITPKVYRLNQTQTNGTGLTQHPLYLYFLI
jgi:hypothetical protein